MSTPEPHKKRRQDRERGKEKSPADGARKRPPRYQKWADLPADSTYLVPCWKTEKYPEEIGSLLSAPAPMGGFIHEGLLYALVTLVGEIELSDHMPKRDDYVYLHPDTMKACGLVIAQPVAIRNPSEKVVAICKPWPITKIGLDAMAITPTTQLSCRTCVGGLVEVRAIPRLPSPVATQLLLKPCFAVNFPLNSSFQNYLMHMHEGCFVCCGNFLSVQFYGDQRLFEIVQVDVTKEDSSVLEDSLLQDMSLLSLQASTPKSGEVKVQGGSTCLQAELESDTAYEQPAEFPLSDIKVYKITSRTKPIFVEDHSNQKKTSQTRLSDVGGLKRQIQLLREIVLYPLETTQVLEHKGLHFPHGVVLHGPPGVGKSLLAQALGSETKAYCDYISAAELMVSLQVSENKLQELFKTCRENSPSFLVIDDLHVLCPHRDSAPSESERRVTATLTSLMDQLNREPPQGHMVVMATTNQLEGVEPSLRRPGRFDKEIEIPVPSARDRKEILDILLRESAHSLSEEELTRIADSAHGHIGADLYAVCMEAQHKALRRSLEGGEGCADVRMCWEDVRVALREVRPSAMREVAIEVPKVLWSDVGGQEEIKQKLKESVEWPLKHPEAFSRLGIQPPQGVLLYGPPGCSKTMIARALATESGLNFIAVKGPELFSKWVGDSERAVRQVFSRARAAAPAIIFFDEIDALAVQRKSEGSSVADRVLAQLLTEMDGVESLREVLVVAATNRPDLIDKALLRPGRIDRIIYVPLPTLDTRREIFKLQFRRTPVAPDVDLDSLVTGTEGFSGAEVVSLCQEAALCAMHEDIATTCVSQSHFQQALTMVKPQTDHSTIHFYENYHRTISIKGGR